MLPGRSYLAVADESDRKMPVTVRWNLPSKYGNQKTNGYASRKEAKRAEELRLLEKAGQINNLKEQVRFELIPAQYVGGELVERACEYVADFTYHDPHNYVVEDKKGRRTKDYIIKRKLMLHVHGIRVRET